MTESNRIWFLEQHVDGVGTRLIELETFPFRIGRSVEADLKLGDTSVSRMHAELALSEGRPLVRDIGSRNGTFVNRQPVVAETALRSGDVLHVGSVEFRLRRVELASDEFGPTEVFDGVLPNRLPRGTRELFELLTKGAVSVFVQPIVEASSGNEHGVELLGRGAHPELPESPSPLFRIAESIDVAPDLSELFRRQGLLDFASSGEARRLFINTHPDELRDLGRFFAGLRQVRADHPAAELVLEVHELAVVDPATMESVRSVLDELDFRLAYDDFGAGESRFLELVRVPPDYLKIDDALIHDLDKASRRRVAMLKMFLKMARDFEISTVAEGVSTSAEAEACRRLGFDYLQGFHLGKPRPVAPASPR